MIPAGQDSLTITIPISYILGFRTFLFITPYPVHYIYYTSFKIAARYALSFGIIILCLGRLGAMPLGKHFRFF